MADKTGPPFVGRSAKQHVGHFARKLAAAHFHQQVDAAVGFDTAAAQNQATDRTHRIGQTRIVTVYKLIAKDSIEEKIQHLQEKKLSLAEDIISADASSLGTLSREDLLELLS